MSYNRSAADSLNGDGLQYLLHIHRAEKDCLERVACIAPLPLATRAALTASHRGPQSNVHCPLLASWATLWSASIDPAAPATKGGPFQRAGYDSFCIMCVRALCNLISVPQARAYWARVSGRLCGLDNAERHFFAARSASNTLH